MTRLSSLVVIVIASLSLFRAAQAQNPTPTITTLSPSAVYAGGPSFTLTVNGTGFVPSTVIYFGGFNPVATTYVSSTQVTAQIAADNILTPATLFLFASNPSPGGGSSNGVEYSIIALDPSISSIAPIAVVAGSGPTTLTVSGENFMGGAWVTFNNRKLPTTYVNSSQLEAQLTAGQVTKPQIGLVAVQNPAPGGLSTDLNFDVTYPAVIRILDIPANDLVWDPNAQLIYASLPSSYGTNGNSIAVIDPTSGKVLGYHFVGSEPNRLALSANGTYLYVGLDGDGSVRRVSLPSFALDINVSLGSSEFGGLNTASALQVSPGDSHIFAVALPDSSDSLEFFRDSTQLPNSISYPTVSSIQFANSGTLYGYANSTLIQVAVNSSGGTVTTEWNDTLVNSSSIVYDAKLIYGDAGEVFDPAKGELIGDYDATGSTFSSSNALLPESNLNSTFVVGTTPFFSSFGITSYNLSQFTPNAVVNLSEFYNQTASVSSLISWGTNGLAFVLGNSACCGNTSSQTILVRSKMMESGTGSN